MFFILSTLTSFFLGLFLTPILISGLKKAKIGDLPGGRKIHKSFIPSMGGIGFVLASAIAMSIWGWQLPWQEIRYLFGAIIIVFFVGLRDDLVAMRATKKLLGQLFAVILVVIVSDIRIKDLHGFLGVGELNLLASYTFSSFILLAITNAFNLVDGLDGLAGTVATIAFSFLGFWFMINGLESYAMLSFTLLGGVLAFLIFNWYPAKIFMGDTGSLTLGFSLGALLIAFMENNAALPTDNIWKFEPVFSAAVTLMIFPLYDMARIFTRRISKGKGPMTPDKCHVHHFLMRMGMKHNQVSLLLGAIQLVFVLMAFILKDYSDNLVLPIISAFALILGFRLDQVTLKYVKKKVLLQPRVLEIRPLNIPQKAKVESEKEEVFQASMNLN